MDFVKERSTNEQIFHMLKILENCSEFGIETHSLFTDFKAAYDNLDRSNCNGGISDPTEGYRTS
jgi:hypothetical protein